MRSVLIDTTNLFFKIRKKFGPDERLDYQKFKEQFPEGTLFRAYVGQWDKTSFLFADVLRKLGYMVVLKESLKRANLVSVCWNVEMTIDALKAGPDVTLCTTDINMLPLLKEKACNVVACGTPKIFRDHALVTEITEDLLYGSRSL